VAVRDVTDFLVKDHIDTKLAALVALLHVGLVGLIVSSIYSGLEPDWPMYWFIGFYVDVPAAVLWLICLPVSFFVERLRRPAAPSRAQTSTLADTLRSIPFYCWVCIVFLAIAGLLQVGLGLGLRLGPASDGANFVWEFTMVGVLGTFIWSDLVRRIVRMLLPPVRQLATPPPGHLGSV